MPRNHSDYIRSITNHIFRSDRRDPADVLLLCNAALETADALEDINARLDILLPKEPTRQDVKNATLACAYATRLGPKDYCYVWKWGWGEETEAYNALIRRLTPGTADHLKTVAHFQQAQGDTLELLQPYHIWWNLL